MTNALSVFRVDDLYSSKEIQESLGVGNAGGVRVSLGDSGEPKRLVVLTAAPNARQVAENPYHDRTEGDYLIYTGAGRAGDQVLAGVNRRIPQQLESRFPIYGFLLIGSRRDQSIGTKRWRFLGLLEYARHYPEQQIDIRRELRQAWIFEFRIHRDPATVPVTNECTLMGELISLSGTGPREVAADREVVLPNTPSPSDHPRLTALEIEGERRRLLALTPVEFEVLIRDVLVRIGFERVSATRFSQDGGIDVNAFAGQQMWPVNGMLLQVQAKRWLHTVGRREVAELRGSLQPFARGAVITTSHFSRAAVIEAIEPGKNPIVLIDGYRFAERIRLLDLAR